MFWGFLPPVHLPDWCCLMWECFSRWGHCCSKPSAASSSCRSGVVSWWLITWFHDTCRWITGYCCGSVCKHTHWDNIDLYTLFPNLVTMETASLSPSCCHFSSALHTDKQTVLVLPTLFYSLWTVIVMAQASRIIWERDTSCKAFPEVFRCSWAWCSASNFPVFIFPHNYRESYLTCNILQSTRKSAAELITSLFPTSPCAVMYGAL